MGMGTAMAQPYAHLMPPLRFVIAPPQTPAISQNNPFTLTINIIDEATQTPEDGL